MNHPSLIAVEKNTVLGSGNKSGAFPDLIPDNIVSLN